MDKLSLGELTIRVDDSEPGTLRLWWEGTSSGRDPGQALRPFLAIVLSRAAERKAVLEQHFERLRYLNSSTIAVLVKLIPEAEERGLEHRFFFDTSLRWQSLSFQAFKPFMAPGKGFRLMPLGSARDAKEMGGSSS